MVRLQTKDVKGNWTCIAFAPAFLAVLAGGSELRGASAAEATVKAASAADQWVTNAHRFPAALEAEAGRAHFNLFATLRAEVSGGRFRVLWIPPSNSVPSAVIHASTGELGHWPARDWREFQMLPQGTNWEATVPIDDPDVPLVYFARIDQPRPAVSPMRVVLPRTLGLDEPTRFFWPYLEGFEEGTGSWRLLAAPSNAVAPRIDGESKAGLSSLVVRIPPGKGSTTLVTTRVRGWQLVRQQASGLRLWLRTREGQGRLRFSLLSHAETPAQTVAAWPRELTVDHHWTRVDLPLAELGLASLAAVDLFAIEFMGNSDQELLVDELQLLGRWRLEGE